MARAFPPLTMSSQNDAVFPKEDTSSAWHLETGDQVQKHYKDVASATQGFDPMGHLHPKFAKGKAAALHDNNAQTIAHKLAANTHKSHTVGEVALARAIHGKQVAAHDKKAVQHMPKKPTEKQMAEAEENAHKLLNQKVWPSTEGEETAWHHESGTAELAHFARVADAATPHEKKVKNLAQTARQMAAEHRKETDAAFPKRWAKQERLAKVFGHVDWHKKELQQREKSIDSKVWGKHTFRSMDLKHALLTREEQTHEERESASKSASNELAGLARLNDAVFPTHVVHKPLKPVQKHDIHRATLHPHSATPALLHH